MLSTVPGVQQFSGSVPERFHTRFQSPYGSAHYGNDLWHPAISATVFRIVQVKVGIKKFIPAHPCPGPAHFL